MAQQKSASGGVLHDVGRWVLISTILASSMAFIDGSALNAALPALQADLQASGAQLLWIVNAYLLMLAALILVGGSLGDRLVDRYGPRLPLVVGPALAGLGFLLMSFVGLTNGPSDDRTTFLPGIVVFGVGMGVTTFRAVMITCAGLAWLSAIMAALLVESRFESQ